VVGLIRAKSRVEISEQPSSAQVSIILPVLNEAKRIDRCLTTLIAQPPEVKEILVVDGGSIDATPTIVERYHRVDARVRLVNATPVDASWTGKAWGIHFGLQQAAEAAEWILTVDADLWVSPKLIRSLLAHAEHTRVNAFSIATRQHLSGKVEAVLHPALLATLVYRYGSPGRAHVDVHRVQANGQCFMSRRKLLLDTGAVRAARSSLCEDMTIARRLAQCGHAVGFYESDGLADVSMYDHWRDTWNNWPRSLALRDQYFGWREVIGLMGIFLGQALPMPALLLGLVSPMPVFLTVLLAGLLALRLGVLFGMARAYPGRPWTYWLSPAADFPAVLRIIQFALRKRHSWRGRTYIRRKGGKFEPVIQP